MRCGGAAELDPLQPRLQRYNAFIRLAFDLVFYLHTHRLFPQL